MPGRRSLVAWVVIVALVALAIVLLRGRNAGKEGVAPAKSALDSAEKARAQGLELLAGGVEAMPEVPNSAPMLESIPVSTGKSVTTEEAKELGRGARRMVHGTVLYSRSRAPVGNVHVTVRTEIKGPRGPEPWKVEEVTKDDGSFLLSLPVDVFLADRECGVVVGDLLLCKRFLVDGMELLVTPERSLHGRIVFDPERPSGELWVILASGEPSSDRRAWRLAMGGDGSFEIPVHDEVLHEDFHISVEARSVIGAAAETTLTELTSQEGARIVLHLTEVRLRICDESGTPLHYVHAEAIRGDRGVPCSSLPSSPEELSAWVGTGIWRISARAEKFEPQEKCVHAHAGQRLPPLEFRLKPSTRPELIWGGVYWEDGKPVSDAQVSVGDDNAKFDADKEGRFFFVPYGRSPWLIQASDPQETAHAALIWSMESSEPRLVLGQGGRLEVILGKGGLPYDSDLLLLDDQRGLLQELSVGSPGRDLPPGDYIVALHMVRPDQYAFERARVVSGQTTKVQPHSEQVPRFLGRVHREDGDIEGLDVLLDAPDWPAALRERWGKTYTGSAGRFEIFAGAQQTPSVRILEDGKELGRFELKSGVPNELRLP